ncbi:TPA: hypothetical protein ACXK4S_000667 [Pseudomonas aeruginosa]
MAKELSQRALAREYKEIVEPLIKKEILKHTKHRLAHPVSSGAYKASEIPQNSRFIIKELPELLSVYGYTGNSKNYCKVLHKSTYAEINSVIESIFGKVVNLKTLNNAQLKKAKRFFGV